MTDAVPGEEFLLAVLNSTPVAEPDGHGVDPAQLTGRSVAHAFVLVTLR